MFELRAHNAEIGLRDRIIEHKQHVACFNAVAIAHFDRANNAAGRVLDLLDVAIDHDEARGDHRACQIGHRRPAAETETKQQHGGKTDHHLPPDHRLLRQDHLELVRYLTHTRTPSLRLLQRGKALIPEAEVLAVSAPVEISWTSKDALLYAVGVGAGTQELAYTTENTKGTPQQVLPTMPVVIGAGQGATSVMATIGTFNPAMLVHGEQSVTLHQPLPPEGTAT